VGMLVFTFIMLFVHTIGTPLTYVYLFFFKHRKALEALKAQELADRDKVRLDENPHLTAAEKEALAPFGTTHRVDAKKLLPGYMRKLTGGYEYRTYWFEVFESIRKVMLVGVPAMFEDRGGATQLVWGLMVCFLTFGGYMVAAPFIKDSDDQTSQLAQAQIFFSLVSSIGLRMHPPNETLGSLLSVFFFFIPIFAILMETPLADEFRGAYHMLKACCGKAMPKLLRAKSVHPQPSGVYAVDPEPAEIPEPAESTMVSNNAPEPDVLDRVMPLEK